jgi:N-acetylglutamate synthase-like GNAT family acetyltransferase
MMPCALTEADLPAATDLLARVGLSGASTMLRRYLRWQPDGVWKLEIDGALAGTVTLLHQGSVGFVGCMAVHPARQGAGLGRRLLEHAQREARRAGITTFLLEATPAGEPLYRQLGYVVEHESMIFTRDGAIAAAPPKTAAADHVDIVALDRKATGCDRAGMVVSLIEEFGGAVIRDGGRLDGYAIAAGDRLGPVIASTAATGRALVERFAPVCATAVAPLANTAAVSSLVTCGFTETRPLRRMRLGPPIAARPDWVWTLASPGAG